MKLLVVGAPEDVTGFALAGVEGVVCTNGEEARLAISNADADTLVLVSAGWAVPRVPRVPEEPEELNVGVVALPARM